MNANAQAGFIFGTGFLALAAYLSWSGSKSGELFGLGDDPLVPPAGGDYDPRKAGRDAFLRAHLAKKFWGSTVLAAQSSTSLNKLSKRIRKYSPEAADEALKAADEAWKLHFTTLKLAQKYNPEWVKLRSEKSGQTLLPSQG